MVIDHRKAQIGEGKLTELAERLVDGRLPALHAREELSKSCFVHGTASSVNSPPMPIPLAIPVGVVLGMALAWTARAELGRSEVPLLLVRPFLISLGLGALVLGPVVAYFASWHGDWAYLYLAPRARIPSAVDFLFILLSALSLPGGFALAAPWAVARRGSRIFQVAAALSAVVVIVAALSRQRLGVSATYAQYHGGFGILPLGQSPLGRGILLSWSAIALAYAWSFHALRSSRER